MAARSVRIFCLISACISIVVFYGLGKNLKVSVRYWLSGSIDLTRVNPEIRPIGYHKTPKDRQSVGINTLSKVDSFVKITTKTKGVVLQQNEQFTSAYVNRRLRYNQGQGTRSTHGHHDILWWNEPNWMKLAKWNENCNLSSCDYTNCRVIKDKRLFNKSSAVIISIVDGGAKRVPVPRSTRNSSQPWVFFTLESPMSFWNSVFYRDEWQNVFNWSLTYRRDADITIPYGWLGERQTRTPLANKDYSAIFRRKTKQAVWLVSHCSTSSRREDYVEQLEKYIDVDIYGDCGKPLDNSMLNQTLSEYKFYIGFENALCKDYITEKFFQYFKQDLIVVVRGLAEYNKLLPNNTFINTADFASIKSLGTYLSELANNEGRYVSYLKEKDRYKVLERWDTYCDGLCNICEKLNNLGDHRNIYDDIFTWAGSCEEPTDLHVRSEDVLIDN